MPDASQLQYYTGYNAYKNLQVRSGVIAVDNTAVSAGQTRTWSTTVTVSDDSKFSTALIQNNRDNNPSVTALKWATFPSANIVWQTLATDPDGRATHNMGIYLTINGNQATFSATTFNDAGSNLAFNAINIGFVYAVHTLDI